MVIDFRLWFGGIYFHCLGLVGGLLFAGSSAFLALAYVSGSASCLSTCVGPRVWGGWGWGVVGGLKCWVKKGVGDPACT